MHQEDSIREFGSWFEDAHTIFAPATRRGGDLVRASDVRGRPIIVYGYEERLRNRLTGEALSRPAFSVLMRFPDNEAPYILDLVSLYAQRQLREWFTAHPNTPIRLILDFEPGTEQLARRVMYFRLAGKDE